MSATASSSSPQDLRAEAPQKPIKRSRSRSEERPAKRAAPQQTQKKRTVKFLIMSDTHAADDDDTPSPFQPPTTPVDVVLHCGDLTVNGTLPSLRKAIDKLAAIPAEFRLVIAGNHDISLDEPFYLAQGGTASAHAAALALLQDHAAHLGITYLAEGTHDFALPSGTRFSIHASPQTPQFGASAFQHPSAQDRFNPAATTPPWATNAATAASTVPANVDVLMTHGPPHYVLDDAGDGRSAGCEHLRRAVCRAKPRLHCAGHVHRGYGARRVRFEPRAGGDGMECLPVEFVGRNQARRRGYASLSPGSAEAMREGGQCLMVNAAVMDGDGRAVNAPWLVELEL